MEHMLNKIAVLVGIGIFAGVLSAQVRVPGKWVFEAGANSFQDIGSANAYQISPSPALSAYDSTFNFCFLPAHSNTGASTLQFNMLGAVAIQKNGNAALTGGEITFNQPACGMYDGSHFQLIGGISSGGFTNPMTTAGDLIDGGASGSPQRLAGCAYGVLSYSSLSIPGCSATLPYNLTIPGFSLGAGASSGACSGICELWTVGSSGVTANTLVMVDTSNPSLIVPAIGFGAYGIAMSTVGPSGTVLVARYGIATLIADTSGVTAGDLVIPGTGTATYGKDSGTSVATGIPISIRVIGRALANAIAGATFPISLTPDHTGAGAATALGLSVANAGTTGTTLNTLTKIVGSGAVITATTDTNGARGICISGCGTSGSASIGAVGLQPCLFDGPTTFGDYVQMSSTTPGNCHDAGSAVPANVQVIGTVLSTNASGGTYNIDFYPPGTPVIAGQGLAPTGSAGGVTFSLNTGFAPSNTIIQNNGDLWLNSATGNTTYQAQPPAQAVAALQQGQAFLLTVDTSCIATSTATLTINNGGSALAQKTLYQADGVTPCNGEMIAGQPRWVYYDGSAFRIMGTPPNAAPTLVTGCSISAHAGNNNFGSYTSGTSGTCTVTITFSATAATGWSCLANDQGTVADLQHQTGGGITTAVIAGTTVSGDVVNYSCGKY